MWEIEQPPGLLDLEFGPPVLAGRAQLPTRKNTVHGGPLSDGMAFEVVQSRAWEGLDGDLSGASGAAGRPFSASC